MKILFLVLILSSQIFAQSNRKDVFEAQKQLENGNLNQAGKILSRIIRKSPENSLALELLGRTYFQKGDFSRARLYFDRMEPGDLSRDGGYAWGASYYEAKKWKKAIFGFKKVPRRSPFRPLAAYFLGISYYRLKRWYPAKRFLLKADSVDLLPTMRRNKAKVLSIIAERREQELEEIMMSDEGADDTSSRAVVIQPAPIRQFIFKEKKDKSELTRDQNFVLKTAIDINQISRTFENHNFVDETLAVTSHKESVEIIYAGYFGIRRQNNLGLRTNVGYGEVATDVTAAKLVSLDQVTGDFIQSETTSSSEAYISASAEPFLTLSLSTTSSFQLSFIAERLTAQSTEPDLDLSYARLNYQYRTKSTEFEMQTTKGSRLRNKPDYSTEESKAAASFKWQNKFVSVGFKLSAVKRDGDIYVTDNPFRTLLSRANLLAMNGADEIQSSTVSLGLSPGELDIKLKSNTTSRSSPLGLIPRQRSTDFVDALAENIEHLELVLSYPLFEGLSIFGRLNSKTIKGYAYEFIDPTAGTSTLYEAEIKQTGSTFGAIAQLFDWVSFNASLGIQNNKYTPVNFEINDDFLKANPNKVNYSKFSLNLFYEF